MSNLRHQLTSEDLRRASMEVQLKLTVRAQEKGMGTLASCHEILGILQEEMTELEAAIHAKVRHRYDPIGEPNEAFKESVEAYQEEEKLRVHHQITQERLEELKDIAVAALFGIASIEAGGVDW